MDYVCRISHLQTPTTLGERYYNMRVLVSLKKTTECLCVHRVQYALWHCTTNKQKIEEKIIGQRVVM